MMSDERLCADRVVEVRIKEKKWSFHPTGPDGFGQRFEAPALGTLHGASSRRTFVSITLIQRHRCFLNACHRTVMSATYWQDR
jgi:hypothetical protein